MTRLVAIQHPDAGITLISRWITGSPERSRAAADALLDVSAADAPEAELATHVFEDVDGAGLLIHGQWTSAEDHLAFVREGRSARVARIDARVPGIERPGLERTHLYRSAVLDTDGEADVFVVTSHDTGGGPEEQQAWADARAAALADAGHEGLLAAHFHLTVDGERVVEIAEWSSAAAAADLEAVHGPRVPHSRYRLYGRPRRAFVTTG
ncbi:antibiotic biosynthesis monooxygenase [Streptomyces rectiverticillatus]|uniref:antibiotic biosynthesis monooxygenase n=1 Tax=Streptomyces rectiverticillatus TaxID=173860 RepID=UPI0015C35C4E|nr:antibiotic biosynthesis monooxygenase [Streptomyces rectiverticillatus]QLE75706.1 antibiotic biosynthesis monooxygenase [Streptomyces rectiverticillatus]